jgi:hypothetical protein
MLIALRQNRLNGLTHQWPPVVGGDNNTDNGERKSFGR